MLQCKVFDKSQRLKNSLYRLFHRPERTPPFFLTQRQARRAFPEEAHRRSSRSVAYVNDARLGQSLDCERREGKHFLLSQAYAHPNPRADSFTLLMLKGAQTEQARKR